MLGRLNLDPTNPMMLSHRIYRKNVGNIYIKLTYNIYLKRIIVFKILLFNVCVYLGSFGGESLIG